jgi:hypothetical protein
MVDMFASVNALGLATLAIQAVVGAPVAAGAATAGAAASKSMRVRFTTDVCTGGAVH